MLADKVLHLCKRYKLFSPNDHVLVAVSGGADSTALLYVMDSIADELGIKIGVAHLNHNLRGLAADGDAVFVERVADSLQLPFLSGKGDVLRLAGEKGISLEMAAREIRYEFFAKAALKAGANTVITAHTSDDQAETVLLKLARGAGAGGLGGIPRKAVMNNIRIVRPFLDINKDEIIHYLKSNELGWCEDASNKDTSFLRNRVRHMILPLMEQELNPRIKDALNRASEIFQAENRWLEEIVAKRLAENVDQHKILKIKAIKNLPLAERRRIIRAWLVLCGIEPEAIDFEAIERIDHVMQTTSRSTNIVGHMKVKKRYGGLSLIPSGGVVTNPFREVLNVPGETVLAEQGLRIVVEEKPGLIKGQTEKAGVLPARASISASAAGRKKLFIRSWKSGDRMRPLGLGGSRKLQDIFVDEKVRSELRGLVPIFECGKEIIWIPGYRVSEGWQLDKKDDPALQIYVERI